MTGRHGNASDHRPTPAAAKPLDEPVAGPPCEPESISPEALLEAVLERTSLQRALKQVCRDQGAPGIDGMTVDALPAYLKHHWPALREQLVSGQYRPQPVKRVAIPKRQGKTRPLGIPTVVDRFIQQAIAQVLSVQWEPHFHPHSYGFRPHRSAHQVVRHMQGTIRAGHGWVVDMRRFHRHASIKLSVASRMQAPAARYSCGTHGAMKLLVVTCWRRGWLSVRRRCVQHVVVTQGQSTL